MSPDLFAHFVYHLKGLAGGKILLCLEVSVVIFTYLHLILNFDAFVVFTLIENIVLFCIVQFAILYRRHVVEFSGKFIIFMTGR